LEPNPLLQSRGLGFCTNPKVVILRNITHRALIFDIINPIEQHRALKPRSNCSTHAKGGRE
jgi:hypothetical protein